MVKFIKLNRDKKEIDNFIDKLNSTLNAANKLNESEAEETKDEIFEELEEESFIGNEEEDEETRKNTIINENKNEFERNRPKRTTFFNEAHSNDYENDFINTDDDEVKNVTIKRNKDTKDDFIDNIIPVGTLGATNHMHNRINSLEKYYSKF